ncbi:hypothetical protein [Pontibacter sp. BAB1700]|uniref:hypothetical protein n=1 Tax=Pontibacter sp. BAB1700 TaxID=1144253 RepID=UPI00026BE455|nr:hypothetical protein [Pontibacter sp. BAB1700]EJF08326.1 hypothetical protein O71_21492 [Pontibacter sp. BAB1700]
MDERQNDGAVAKPKFTKMASDGAYKLAKHLLTYQLNVADSKTYSCALAAAAATEAQALLAKYCFNGTASSYLPSNSKNAGIKADYARAIELAKIFDRYNNNIITESECEASMTATSTTSLEGLDLAESDQLRAYPTPFTDKAVIEFRVAQDESYSMRLYDMRGAWCVS